MVKCCYCPSDITNAIFLVNVNLILEPNLENTNSPCLGQPQIILDPSVSILLKLLSSLSLISLKFRKITLLNIF